MNPREAAEAIRDGKTVRLMVGQDADDPILLVWADRHGDVQSYVIEGWSQGIQETVCEIESPFLEGNYLKAHALEIVEHPEWLNQAKG